MKYRKHLHTLVVLSLLATFAFATNGTRMIGFDVKAIGRGGSSIGFFDNASLMFSNPAGISFLNESRLDGNFSLMVPGLKFTNGLNNAKGKTNYFPIINIGYVNNSTSDFTWGVGAFTQGGMGADFTLNHQLFRDQSGNLVQQEYHSKLAVMQGGLSAAYKLTENVSIGVSTHAVYSMLEFRMPYSLSPSIMRGVANPQTGMTFGQMFAAPPQVGGFGYAEVTAYAAMNDLKAFGFSGKGGIAWNAADNVTLGVSYTSPSSLTYKNGKAKMDMSYQFNDAFAKAVQGVMQQNPTWTVQQAQQAVMGMFGQMGMDMTKGVAAEYDLEAKLKFPQSVGVGGMFKLSDAARLGFDFEWINWKNAFDKMSITLRNGTNSNINTMLGGSSLAVEFPMLWEDSYNVRLGLEVDPSNALIVRFGGAFGSNPVANATVFPVFPAVVENHLTVGITYKLSTTVAVNAAYEHALMYDAPSITPNLVAQEYNGSTSSLKENIFHLSFSWLMP
jgi:long-chain fatty acid transport protein